MEYVAGRSVLKGFFFHCSISHAALSEATSRLDLTIRVQAEACLQSSKRKTCLDKINSS